MRSWQYDTFSSSILFADAKNVHIMHNMLKGHFRQLEVNNGKNDLQYKHKIYSVFCIP
jgi:hypothetical protein